MTKKEIEAVVSGMIKKKQLVEVGKFYKCTLKPNKEGGYAQVDVTSYCKESGVTGKQLVHLIYWRFINDGAQIREGFEISHLCKDNTVLNVLEESWEMNQSRIYCHYFGWYKTLPGEDRPRCPHWENQCTE